MLVPRYYFTNDYAHLYNFFLSCPHKKRLFQKNEYLWKAGDNIKNVYYIISGIVQTNVEHENGFQKILHFHSKGSIFPGCHESRFKIEKSITTKAITHVETLEFSRTDFFNMMQSNREIAKITLEVYASYINLYIFENAHQEYNSSFIKLCNFLYLFSQNSPNSDSKRVNLTQNEIGDILTTSRVNIANNMSRLRNEKIIITYRNRIEIINLEKLRQYCSDETFS